MAASAWRKKPVTFAASAGDDLAVTVDSVAAFRSSSSIPSETTKVTIRGYYGPNTSGGGDFLIDRTDTTTADDGVLTFTNGDGLRIKRSVSNGVLNTSQAGIQPNTDISAKWNDLVGSLLSNPNFGKILFDLPGTYDLYTSVLATTGIAHQESVEVDAVPDVYIRGTGKILQHRLSVPTSTRSLTADLNKGDHTISLDSTVESGQILFIECYFTSSSTAVIWKQPVTVSKDTDGVININTSKFFFPSNPWTLPDGTREIATRITVYENVPNFSIKNLNFIGVVTGSNNPANIFPMMEFHGANVVLENVTYDSSREADSAEKASLERLPGLVVQRYGNLNATNIKARNSGYTIWLQDTQKSLIEKSQGEKVRHLVAQNHCHDTTVRGSSSINGGLIDGHGYWDLILDDCDMSDAFGLNNARGQGNLTVKDCQIRDSFLAGSASYLPFNWAEDSANVQFYQQNMGCTLSMVDSTVEGSLRPGPVFTTLSIKNSKIRFFHPMETFFSTLSAIPRTVFLENCTDLDGTPWYYPSAQVSSGNRNNTYRNLSNPLNIIDPVFVDSTESANGNLTYVFPCDSLNLNIGDLSYKWTSGRNFIKKFNDGTTFTLVFLIPQTGFPHMGPREFNNVRLLTLRIQGYMLHNNAFNISDTEYEDVAKIYYNQDGLRLIQNFTATRGSTNYRVLEITGSRATNQGDADGSPVEPIPAQFSEWSTLHRIEIDVAVEVDKSNGGVVLALETETMFL